MQKIIGHFSYDLTRQRGLACCCRRQQCLCLRSSAVLPTIFFQNRGLWQFLAKKEVILSQQPCFISFSCDKMKLPNIQKWYFGHLLHLQIRRFSQKSSEMATLRSWALDTQCRHKIEDVNIQNVMASNRNIWGQFLGMKILKVPQKLLHFIS